NVISGSSSHGVLIDDGASANVVTGNFIGVNPNGTAPLPNSVGVGIDGDGNTVGGTTIGAGNVISGNATGVLIDRHGTGNSIQGNLVGTNLTGTAKLPNGDGIKIAGSENTIGGTVAGAGNVISGNAGAGIDILGSHNLVQGNSVGANSAGRARLANRIGILIQ